MTKCRFSQLACSVQKLIAFTLSYTVTTKVSCYGLFFFLLFAVGVCGVHFLASDSTAEQVYTRGGGFTHKNEGVRIAPASLGVKKAVFVPLSVFSLKGIFRRKNMIGDCVLL